MLLLSLEKTKGKLYNVQKFMFIYATYFGFYQDGIILYGMIPLILLSWTKNGNKIRNICYLQKKNKNLYLWFILQNACQKQVSDYKL